MIAVYVALGSIFLFTDIAIETFPAYRKEIGATLLIYSIIRVLLQKSKNKKEKNEYPD